ncbi:MAG: CpXC domain-containing protein [Promethearchaeota archaeon]
MTRIDSREIDCPHCGNHFRIMWEASINTWLDPDLIQKLLNDQYYYTCPNCEKQTHLVTKILINCPKGMFWISNGEELEVNKRILEEYNVIDKEGNILKPIMGVNLPAEDHPGLISYFGKEIEKFKNELLGDNRNNIDKNEKRD